MTIAIQCPRCPSILSALELGEHIGRIHIGRVVSLWICADCPFESASLYDAVAHCLSENHDPQALRCSVPNQLLDLAKQAQLRQSARQATGMPAEPTLQAQHATRHQTYPQDATCYSEASNIISSQARSPKSTRKRTRKLSTSQPSQDAPQEQDLRISGYSACQSMVDTLPRHQPLLREETPSHTSDREYESDEHGSTSVNAICMQERTPMTSLETDKETWVCRQCSAVVKTRGNKCTGYLISHVISCTKVKPYACGGCGFENRSKYNVRRHMTECKSNGSSIVLRAKEQHEAELRQGMIDCFPLFDYHLWGGLKE